MIVLGSGGRLEIRDTGAPNARDSRFSCAAPCPQSEPIEGRGDLVIGELAGHSANRRDGFHTRTTPMFAERFLLNSQAHRANHSRAGMTRKRLEVRFIWSILFVRSKR